MAGVDVSRRGFVAGAAGLALAGAEGGAARGAPAGPSAVMIVRHAEKPERGAPPPYGLGPDGAHDPHALTVRGWQRAGALVRLFAPREGAPPVPGLARPDFLFAAAPTRDHPSRRSVLTLGPLAALIGVEPDASFGPDREAEAAAAILRRSGVGLVAWEHKRIGDLVAALTDGSVEGVRWPSDRYDVVLVLRRDGPAWRLAQVPQMLLAGDGAEALPPARG